MRSECLRDRKVSAVVMERIHRYHCQRVRLQSTGATATAVSPAGQRVRFGGRPADRERQRVHPQRFCGRDNRILTRRLNN